MKFWPFPIVRLHAENKDLTRLFLLFAEAQNLKVLSPDRYALTVSSEHGTLCFWGANEYHAWASSGWHETADGTRIAWWGEMPSRYAVRAMAKAINFSTPKDKKFTLGDSQ